MPFPVSISITHALFDLIHVDIWGPVSIPSFQGYRYFLTIVDDFTHFTWIHLMRLKSDVKRLLFRFLTTIENQYSVTLKRIRSDNGKEFMLTDGLTHLLHVRTNDQIADMLTKALVLGKFRENLSKLGLLNIHATTCGGILSNSHSQNTTGILIEKSIVVT